MQSAKQTASEKGREQGVTGGSPIPARALGVIGAGNMGRAIVLGALRAGELAPEMVVVAEPDPSKHAALAAHGIRVLASASLMLAALEEEREGQILLAVKPQMLGGVGAEIGAALARTPRVVISILAGTPTAKVRSMLGGAVPVVRAMPNLAASVGAGATALCVGEGATETDAQFAARLFAAVGPLVIRCDEAMMDAFTAVAGSGPAYLYYLAEAMIAGARAVGFEDLEARRIVRQTLAGAMALFASSSEEPAALRAAVTSKGGTTAAAAAALDARGVMKAWEEAIVAARDRGRELGREGSRQ